MKKPKTKAQVRAEIEAQMTDYLQRGGEVAQFARGESSLSPSLHPFKVQSSDKPTESRTSVQDAVAAIESRRKTHPKSKAPMSKRPKKVLIKDDFGQPLRWVWEE
ncbi:hypothetical protein [Halioxenophilus aromaticivorans]